MAFALLLVLKPLEEGRVLVLDDREHAPQVADLGAEGLDLGLLVGDDARQMGHGRVVVLEGDGGRVVGWQR